MTSERKEELFLQAVDKLIARREPEFAQNFLLMLESIRGSEVFETISFINSLDHADDIVIDTHDFYHASLHLTAYFDGIEFKIIEQQIDEPYIQKSTKYLCSKDKLKDMFEYCVKELHTINEKAKPKITRGSS